MKRRTFFKTLGLTGAAVAGVAVGVVPAAEIDPERLLWTPGGKTYFLPAKPTIWEQAYIDQRHATSADLRNNIVYNNTIFPPPTPQWNGNVFARNVLTEGEPWTYERLLPHVVTAGHLHHLEQAGFEAMTTKTISQAEFRRLFGDKT